MPLIPNDDPEALAELLGYLGEIGYGELYLRRAPAGGGGTAAAEGLRAGETSRGSRSTTAAGLRLAARQRAQTASAW